MKKIVFIIFFLYSYCFAATWSHAGSDGFHDAYNGLYDYIEEQNNLIKERYKEIRKNQITNILAELEKKRTLLENLQTLSTNDAVTKTEQVFLIDIKKELKSILIDTWGEE